MHVGLGGEEGVDLQGSPPGIKGDGRQVLHGDHHMGVPHSHGRHSESGIGKIGFAAGQAVQQRQCGGNG